jgi:hypothetical protein
MSFLLAGRDSVRESVDGLVALIDNSKQWNNSQGEPVACIQETLNNWHTISLKRIAGWHDNCDAEARA